MKGFSLECWGGRPARVSRPAAGLFLVLVLALVLAACSNGLTASGALVSGTVIDHYTIGDPLDCPDNGNVTCDGYLRIATDTVTGKRGVAPTAIVGYRFYHEGIQPPPGAVLGGPPVAIVVFDLADGSRDAVGVSCGVGPCQVVTR